MKENNRVEWFYATKTQVDAFFDKPMAKYSNIPSTLICRSIKFKVKFVFLNELFLLEHYICIEDASWHEHYMID